MGREVRMVPKGWEHPKNAAGDFIPMLKEFGYNEEEVAEGLRDGWLSGDGPHYGVPVMPSWSQNERTHYMMYEDTTEGTPISPAFETPEELARWLVDNKASALGGDTASYEAWLRVAKGAWAPSAIYTPEHGLQSGVEGSR